MTVFDRASAGEFGAGSPRPRVAEAQPSMTSAIHIEKPPCPQDRQLGELYEYWLSLGTGDGQLPDLRLFDPTAMPRILANICIVVLDEAAGQFRVRIAGEEINAIFGGSIVGKLLTEFMPPKFQGMMFLRYQRILVEPAVFYQAGPIYLDAGRQALGERLAMPMHGRSGRVDTILGATTYRYVSSPVAPELVMTDEGYFFPIKLQAPCD
jgi:hypothetical protein